MFGYVTVNEEELKIKEYKKYRSYYCGICKSLQENCGNISRMSLNFDMTFLAILLDGVYESKKVEDEKRCVIHPINKRIVVKSEIIDYAAKMNVLLMYYKLLDDWNDEKNHIKYAYAKVLKQSCKNVISQYKNKAEKIKEKLDELSALEKKNIRDIDAVAGCFGELTACIFEYKEDIFKENLGKMGFFLGKYIYILDAYDDVENDIKNGEYNPFSECYKQENFDENVREMLTMMMAECAKAFEMLPIIENVDILRNIIYSGVWLKYEQIYTRRHKGK